MMGNLTSRATWLVAGKFIAFVLSMLTPFLIARRLDLVTIGTYKQVFMIITSATNILPLGFATCAYYFLPREPARQREIVMNILIVLTAIGITAGLMAYLFPVTLVALVGDARITQYALYICLIMPLAILAQGFETIVMAHQEVQLAAMFTVGIQASRTISLFLAVVFWATTEAIVISYLIHSLAAVFLMWFYLNSRFPEFWRHFNKELLKEQFSYALPIQTIALMWTIQMEMHSYFVSSFFGAEALAIYTNGCFQLPIMGLISDSSTSVIIPRMTEMRKINDDREILALVARVMRKLAVASIFLYCYMATVSEPLMLFLWTSKFQASAPIFFVNITLILATILPVDPLMRIYPEYRFFFVRFRIFLVAGTALALWKLTPIFGPSGAIAVFVATVVFDKLFTAGAFVKILKIGRKDLSQFRDVLKIAICGAVAALSSLAVRHQTIGWSPFYILMATGIAFTIVFVLMLLLTQIANTEEKEMIRKMLPAPLKQLIS